MTTSTNASVDLIAATATEGRGLWIGMFVPDAQGDLTGLHVTLAHLGKTKDGARAIRAANELAELAPARPPIEAWTWGQARLDQYAGCVSVVLLESIALHALQATLAARLLAASVKTDRTFEFHPHVTLARYAADDTVSFRRRARRAVPLPSLSLVCGSDRLDYPLTGGQ